MGRASRSVRTVAEAARYGITVTITITALPIQITAIAPYPCALSHAMLRAAFATGAIDAIAWTFPFVAVPGDTVVA